jgi:hypothetical protein
LSSALSKSVEGVKSSSTGNIQVNLSLSQEEKVQLQRQIDQAMQKLASIKDVMNSEMNSCNKTLEEIVETQINIFKNLQ